MNDASLLKKAEYQKKRGKLNEARNIYLHILRKKPDHFHALSLLGTLYAQQNRMQDAVHFLEKAAAQADNPGLQNNLGNAYRAMGDTDKARQCYANALKFDSLYARAYHGLGVIYLDIDNDREKAFAHFETALSLNPDIAEFNFSYGSLLVDRKDIKGLKHLEKAYKINPNLPGLMTKLGVACLIFDKVGEARLFLEGALREDPSDIIARYYLCLAEGNKPDKELRKKYVEKLFDKYSDRFEEELTDKLDYKIPTTSREILERIHGCPLRFDNMVDLGCGTGLSGQAFRDCTQRLTGIDLSGKMLQEASRKNIYDALIQGEIIQVLDASDSFFDFFLATDLLVYLQELVSLFTAIRNRASSGALLVFTTESHNNHEDYIFRESGRTAHNPQYIHRLTDRFNIKIAWEQRLPIRREASEWIEGDLFICQLP